MGKHLLTIFGPRLGSYVLLLFFNSVLVLLLFVFIVGFAEHI